MESDKRIREIESRCLKVTPGPWERKGSDAYIFSGGMIVAQVKSWGYLTTVMGLPEKEALEIQKATVELIANAPQDISFLLDVVRGLRAELALKGGEQDA